MREVITVTVSNLTLHSKLTLSLVVILMSVLLVIHVTPPTNLQLAQTLSIRVSLANVELDSFKILMPTPLLVLMSMNARLPVSVQLAQFVQTCQVPFNVTAEQALPLSRMLV